MEHYEKFKKQQIAGDSWMHYAAQHRQPRIVRLLAKLGENANQYNDCFITPLHYAICWGNLETVAVFVRELGVPLNSDCWIIDEELRSPLSIASTCSTPSILNFLIDNGADVNYTLDSLPILSGCIKVSLENIKTLVERGADIHKLDSNSFTPIHHAIVYSKIETVKYLLTQSKIQMDPGWLLLAVNRGNVEIVKLILERVENIKKIFDDEIDLVNDLRIELRRQRLGTVFFWNRVEHTEVFDLLIERGVPLPESPLNQFLLMVNCKIEVIMEKYVQLGWVAGLCERNFPESNVNPLLDKVVQKEYEKIKTKK